MNDSSAPSVSASATAPAPTPSGRILSVDALRGFDMFWIIGAEEVARALDAVSDGPVVAAVTNQLRHVEWAGFHFLDAIFPLFLFLVGVSAVLSLDRVLVKEGRRGALLRIAQRSFLLLAVGLFYYGGFTRPWPDVQVFGVLPRIALCYFGAATLYVLVPRKGIVLVTAACLIGYWAALTWMPFPEVNLKHGNIGKRGTQAEAKAPAVLLAGVTTTVSGTFEEGRNLAHYADYRLVPGKQRNLYYTNEGLISTIPALATTLCGLMAGWLLTSSRWTGKQKVAWLLGAGAAGIVLGLGWSVQFPIIKRIWTSSFSLVASGCAALLLGVFYLIVDVWRWQKWCTPFIWIGSNALVVYLAVNVIDFEVLAARFAGGDVKAWIDLHLAAGMGNLVIALTGLALPVLLVRFLYHRKIFIRL
jgi:hypothetical protein